MCSPGKISYSDRSGFTVMTLTRLRIAHICQHNTFKAVHRENSCCCIKIPRVIETSLQRLAIAEARVLCKPSRWSVIATQLRRMLLIHELHLLDAASRLERQRCA